VSVAFAGHAVFGMNRISLPDTVPFVVVVNAVNAVAPFFTVIVAVVVGSTAALIASKNASVLPMPMPSLVTLIGSVLKLIALVSPGVQFMFGSPSGGAHTFSPRPLTTLSANPIEHVVLVGKAASGMPPVLAAASGISTIAGPSASNPPIAGTCWKPD